MRPFRMWCVILPFRVGGIGDPYTLARTREEAIRRWGEGISRGKSEADTRRERRKAWARAYRRGVRCIRVTVTAGGRDA